MKSKTVIVIPARMESSRLPGKVLLDIHGQTMLERVWRAAIASQIGPVYIATDSQQVIAAANLMGATVISTQQADSGTSRIAGVINQLSLHDTDVVINWQADEPLLPGKLVSQLAVFAHTSDMAAASMCSVNRSSDDAADSGVVKVVCDDHGRALYFSRGLIPHEAPVFLQHHGVYAYKKTTLDAWVNLTPGKLEQLEQLEQLRLLENGLGIAMLKIDRKLPAGVDTLVDLENVRALLA